MNAARLENRRSGSRTLIVKAATIEAATIAHLAMIGGLAHRGPAVTATGARLAAHDDS